MLPHQHPERTAVAVIHSAFRLEVLDFASRQLAEAQIHEFTIVRRQDIDVQETEDGIRFPAKHRLVGPIGIENPAVDADKRHADRRVLRDLAQQRTALIEAEQLCVGLFGGQDFHAGRVAPLCLMGALPTHAGEGRVDKTPPE